MAAKGRSGKPPNLGDFNFLGGGDGDHEGSVAFSDISFPSHVSDLESFHSDLDISMHSRESLSADDGAAGQYENGGDRNIGYCISLIDMIQIRLRRKVGRDGLRTFVGFQITLLARVNVIKSVVNIYVIFILRQLAAKNP